MPSHADTLVPQLAIDRLVYEIQRDVQTFALDYLIMRQTVKSLSYRRDQEVRADAARAGLHPTVAENMGKRLDAVCARLDAIEDRIGGRGAL